jgi:hypothetical protein
MFTEKEQQLKLKLKNIIREFGYDNNLKQDVMNEFKSRNLDSLRPAWVFSENLDLDTLNSEEDTQFLFIFSLALDKALKEKNINMLNDYKSYFTSVEINEWENYREEKDNESIFPINFKNVTEIAPGYWQTTITAQELERLNKANVLIYNVNSQRGFKVTKKKIGIDLNPKKVEEIAIRMLDGEQFPDDIKFNVLKTGEERIFYNPKTRILTVQEGSIINIFDGMHRKSGNSLFISRNPDDTQFIWPLKITNFTEIKTHDVMTQINKQSPIDVSVLSTKDYSKNENLVLDKIIDSKGDLANTTKDKDEFVKSNRGLTTKPILAEAIKDNYGDQLESAMNRDTIANWIVEFTNYLMGVFSNEFIVKPYEVKRTSYINNLNMFYGYITLSAVLKDNNDWKEILKQKIESIDFSIDNPMWQSIGIIKENKINNPIKNKLYKLFKEV